MQVIIDSRYLAACVNNAEKFSCKTYARDVNICMQIGLHATAEMVYLTESDWRAQIAEQPLVNQVPDIFDYPKWIYFGIDCDPGSVILQEAKYRYEDAYWMCAKIAPESNFTHSFVRNHLLVPSLSFSSLLKLLDLDRIDVLKMDIEGCELEIFESYDFKIRPRFLSIETHDIYRENCLSTLKAVLAKHSYTIINQMDTNKGATVELQAIAEEIYGH